MERFMLFLYGNKNIVGSLAALGALGLFFGGVIHAFWLPIVLGSYGIGYLATPSSKELETSISAQMSSEQIKAALDALAQSIKGRVPAEVATLVDSISQSIIAILPTLSKDDTTDQNTFMIRQTALEYLPETLNNYLKLPPAFRSLYPVQDGKTATALLVEQLTLLDTKLKESVANYLSNDTQALVANGRFLADKFKTQNFLTPV
ncbi:MAG TPA: hypothetical protein VKF82_11445 [Candidatus Eremiobacteraceae bacterium]|nr:hypothetical protein [Candidatus Eremiobacteraceae bacterium]